MAGNDIEQRVNDLEKKVIIHDEKFNAFMRSMDDFKQEMREFKQEMREFKQEMRDRDNQRATEIRELRQRQEAQHTQHEADMRQMNDKLNQNNVELRRDVHNIFLAAAIGIGAMILTVVAPLIISAFKAVDEPKITPQSTIQTPIEQMPSEVLLPRD